MLRLFLPAVLLLSLPQDKGALEKLRELSQKTDADSRAQAAKVLRAGIDGHIKAAFQAYANGNWKEMETQLLRAAQLGRTYSTEHARALVRIVLSQRRELRLRAGELVRGVAADAKRKSDAGARQRIAGAKAHKMFAGVFAKELGELEGKIATWSQTPPGDASVEAEVDRWGLVLSPVAGRCAACAGSGEIVCKDCANGVVKGDCPRCKASGSIACALCEGAGAVSHSGYAGWIEIDLPNDVKVTVKDEKGKKRTGTLPAQTVRYEMDKCAGRGSFDLITESKVKKTGASQSGSARQTCDNFWEEMKRFVFTGKASIRVPDREGKVREYTRESARRLLADYENCKDGKVKCDRCAGRKTSSCAACAGAKKADLPCGACAGGGRSACGTCFGLRTAEDISWLAALVTPDSVKDLSAALAAHGAQVERWLADRSQASARRGTLARRLDEALNTQNPAANLHDDYVSLPCPACKGAGGACGECWGTGRREHYEGTPQYETYAAAAKLRRQIADLDAQLAAGPPAAALPADAAAPMRLPDIPPPPPKPGTDVAFQDLPPKVLDDIKQADAYHEQGKKHLENADSKKNPNGWVDESYKAVAAFRQGQTHYAGAQETLDAMGLPVPKELLDRYRTNLQGLVMARKHAP